MDLAENYLTEKGSKTANALFLRNLFSGTPSDATIIFIFGTLGRFSSFNESLQKQKMEMIPQDK